jgi:prevent-host-death family protein
MLAMRMVNVADLKSHLSRYLREVRGGGEILVQDRGTPIARIVPLSVEDELDVQERALVAQGKLRPAEQPLPDSFFTMPAARLSQRKAAAAVSADRDEKE